MVRRTQPDGLLRATAWAFTGLAVAAARLALLQLASASSSFAAAICIKGEHKLPYKLGWAHIYSIPTWMKETTGTIEDMANELKKHGLVAQAERDQHAGQNLAVLAAADLSNHDGRQHDQAADREVKTGDQHDQRLAEGDHAVEGRAQNQKERLRPVHFRSDDQRDQQQQPAVHRSAG